MINLNEKDNSVKYKENNIQVMRYIGNKRAILDDIIPIIESYINKDKATLDLFAGTSSVGYALKPNSIIFSNDIQEYGRIVARGLMGNYKKEEILTQLSKIDKFYLKNKKVLDNLLEVPLKEEDYFLNCEINDENMIKYNDYMEKYPYYLSGNTGYGLDNWITTEIEDRKKNPTLFPYILCTMYYSNGFYSIKQSIDIDCIRYAIDNVTTDYTKSLFLVALLYAMSSSITSTGHYSQYRNVNSLKSYKEIQKLRNKDIFEKFINRVKEMIEILVDNSDLEEVTHINNTAYRMNYIDVLNDKEVMEKVGCIYADPPYTKDNYSRYYHVPESIVLYDYPELIMHKTGSRVSNGRYRQDKYTSPFCKRKEAFIAFEDMIKNSAKWNIPLIISYSDNSIVPIEELDKLVKKYYNTCILHSFSHKHSKLGREGIIELKEYLIIGI